MTTSTTHTNAGNQSRTSTTEPSAKIPALSYHRTIRTIRTYLHPSRTTNTAPTTLRPPKTHRIATRLLQHPNNRSADEHIKLLKEVQAAHPHLDTHADHITAIAEIPTGRHDDRLDT